MKINRLYLIGLLVLVLVARPLPLHAQSSAQPIKYEDTLTSTIDDKTTAVSFQFSGGKNDVVLVQLLTIPDKDGKELTRPDIALADSRGKSLADTKDGTIVFFGGSGTFLVGDLSAKDDYTITVSKNPDSTSNGQFTLHLSKVDYLKQDKPVSGSLSSRAQGVRFPAVYAVDSKDDFGVQYVRDAASKFYPSVTVYAVDRAGVPVPVNYMAGSRFLAGTLGVEGSKDLYLVMVGDLDQDVHGNREKNPEQTADFTLTLVALTAGASTK